MKKPRPRIAIAGFMHESNTFASFVTELRHFREANLESGDELLPVWEAAHHEMGGFISGCREWGVELVPVLMASATPGGPLTDECYETILNSILTGLDQIGPFDGVLLALHGAMVSATHQSADGETLRRIRQRLGADMPIVVSLDLHGNVSAAMAGNATAIVAYQTYPHVDQRARGEECVMIMRKIIEEGARPQLGWHKIPMLLHIVQQYSGAGPFAEIMDEVRCIAKLPGVLSASFLAGYIYADVECMGPCAVVVSDGGQANAQQLAEALGQFAWSRREQLNATLPSIETAIEQAMICQGGPVCLMDCGDNIGGGGPGDSTLIYSQLVDQGVRDVLVVLHDPDAVKACVEAGVRQAIQLNVGGHSVGHGEPVAIEGRIRLIHAGQFIEPEPRHGGKRHYDQGMTAVVDTALGHTVVVNTYREAPMSLMQIVSLGIEPRGYKIIIVKGVTAPRAAYEPIAAKIIPVDSPGITQAGPESFDYKRRPQPMFPLEPVE